MVIHLPPSLLSLPPLHPAPVLEPYCEDQVCKNDKLLTSTCTEAMEYRLWMKLSGPHRLEAHLLRFCSASIALPEASPHQRVYKGTSCCLAGSEWIKVTWGPQ